MKVRDTVDVSKVDAATEALRVALAYPAGLDEADDARLAAMEVAHEALRLSLALGRAR